MTSCVYALTVPRPVAVRGRGLADEALRVITVGRVSAIVGTLRRPPATSAASLKRFAAVVQRLHERVPALLPARFLTCFDDPDELLMVLRSRQQPLRRALAHVRGRSQMTVRIIGVGVVPESCRSRVGVSPKSGTAYLRGRAASVARERDVPGFERVRAAVRRWVRDERVQKSEGIASVYHLVPKGSVDAYRRALEGAAESAGLRVSVTGPFPPYAFADL